MGSEPPPPLLLAPPPPPPILTDVENCAPLVTVVLVVCAVLKLNTGSLVDDTKDAFDAEKLNPRYVLAAYVIELGIS